MSVPSATVRHGHDLPRELGRRCAVAGRWDVVVTVNVVVLAGTVAADPVQRRMPSGDEVTELRVSVPELGKRLLPLPVAAWHGTVGPRALDGIAKGDAVLVHGQLVRRFYRSGAGARSLTEVVATGIKKLQAPVTEP
jgi:single-strand DNA-binding protein